MDKNSYKAWQIYENQGQNGVFKACNDKRVKFDYWQYCQPCEYESPIYNKCCLVCGTFEKKKRKE
jgi:hypothetical protein